MSMQDEAERHPDFATLGTSWELALSADGYAKNTLASYGRALVTLAGWLAEHHPGVGPLEVTRDQIRGWLVHVRESASSGTARSWFAGVRHFCRWMLAEEERDDDPTAGIRTPKPNDPSTPVLSDDDVRALLGTCGGRTFLDRRDRALILLLVDGGLRLAEVTNLKVDSVDVRERVVLVVGKGSDRSGPRRRAVQLGVKAAQALDRYLRERRRHPYAESTALWLGDRNRPTLSADAVDAMLKRRAARIGLSIHPHMLRHTWASAFRAAGGSEGDLMHLGGWRSRAMLDRYGKVAAGERARDAYRKLSLGDRL